MTRAVVLALVLAGGLGACGRFGFDAAQSGSPDAGPGTQPDAPLDGPIDAPAAPQITCGQAVQGSGNIPNKNDNQLAVSASADGLFAVTADDTGNLLVWTFDIASDGGVTPSLAGTTLDTGTTGAISVMPTPGGVLVSAGYDSGTKLYPLDNAGNPRALPAISSGYAEDGALAPSGIDGTLAFVEYVGSGEIDAQLVDASGNPSGSPKMIVPQSVGAYSVVIAPAATGYAVTWTDPSTSPNSTVAVLLGPDLSIVAGPVTASTNSHDSEVGTIAWAPQSGRYLVAWQNKDSTGADEVQIREYDQTLSPLRVSDATILTNTGHPQLATDGTGFALTARSWNPDKLVYTYVDAAGAVTPEADTVDANALQWATTQHGSQPVVSWLTAGALWVESPCGQ